MMNHNIILLETNTRLKTLQGIIKFTNMNNLIMMILDQLQNYILKSNFIITQLTFRNESFVVSILLNFRHFLIN